MLYWLRLGCTDLAITAMAERCSGVVWRGEVQIVLDLVTEAGSCISRHIQYSCDFVWVQLVLGRMHEYIYNGTDVM